MSQIGAVFYVLWGLLHFVASFQVCKLGSGQKSGMIQGRIYQHAWNLACIALVVPVIAVIYCWTNDLFGYWLNLVITSVTDIGFILFVMVPRYLPLKLSILGPLLWVLAMIFSTIGFLFRHL